MRDVGHDAAIEFARLKGGGPETTVRVYFEARGWPDPARLTDVGREGRTVLVDLEALREVDGG